jgi:hypothetical protein
VVQFVVRDYGRHPPRIGIINQKPNNHTAAGVFQVLSLHRGERFGNSIISVDIFRGIWYIYTQNDEMAQITVRSQIERPEGAHYPFPSPEWETL